MNGLSPFWPTLTTVFGLVCWAVVTRLRVGSLLSPYSTMLLLLIAIFGLRPLMMLESGQFDFYGLRVAAGFEAAARIGFVAVLSVNIGYAFGAYSKRSQDHQPLPESYPAAYVKRAASASSWTALLVLLVWLAFTVVSGGGLQSLASAFDGRSEDRIALLRGVPAIVPALPVVAAVLIGATRFRLERIERYAPSQNLLYWLTGVLCVIPPLALGNRRFLIPSVIVILIGSAVSQWRRRIRLPWALGALAAFVALAILPFVRSAGSRTGRTDLIGAMADNLSAAGVSGVLRNFFLSYDTEMFSYISYLAPLLGGSVPFGSGRGTVGEALLVPLPTAIAPFDKWSDVLLTHTFGSSCGVVVCPVPSVVGQLYFDLAIPGVVAGMLVLGLLTSRFESSLFSVSRVGSIALLLLAGFMPAIARGNPISQLWIATQCFVLLVILDLWVSRRARNHERFVSGRQSALPLTARSQT